MNIHTLTRKLRPGTRRSIAGALGLLLILGLLVSTSVPVLAVPPIPETFIGAVTINGSQAPQDTTVESRIGGVTYGSAAVNAMGNYNLSVLGNDPETPAKDGGVDGDTIDFYVNNVLARSTTYATQTVVRNFNLDVVIIPGPFTLTVTSNGCSTINVVNSTTSTTLGSVAAGQTQAFPNIIAGNSVQVTASDTTTCDFTNWVVDGGAPDINNPLTITMNANHTAVANSIPLGPFSLTVNSPDCCTITVSVADAQCNTVSALGTVNPGQTQTFNDIVNGTRIRLAAAGTTCCNFTSWTIDGGQPNPANPVCITMNANHTAVANCSALGPYMLGITWTPLEGGGVSGGGSKTCGTTATVQATPAQGYRFVNWTGDISGNTNPTTILMDSPKNVVAHFELLPPFDLPGAIMELNLGTGWNTFSTPIALGAIEDTWGELIAVNNLNVDIVYAYNSSTGIWVQRAGNDPVKIIEEGYYIKLLAPGTIEIVPSADATPVPLRTISAGLNLIGFASLTDMPVTTYLTTAYSVPGGVGYQFVFNPPINAPNDFSGNVFVRDSSPSPTMKVGKAYWVYMINPGPIVGFTSTPLP